VNPAETTRHHFVGFVERQELMEIVIGSDQERDNLFAEIHVEGQPWAEVIFQDARNAYGLTIFPRDDGGWLAFDLAETRQLLLDAKNALVARGYPDRPV
jgi:hypothetical protein